MRSSASGPLAAPGTRCSRIATGGHGSPEWKPSGIPVAVVCDHGAVVRTGFPPPDAGRGPRRSRNVRSRPLAIC